MDPSSDDRFEQSCARYLFTAIENFEKKFCFKTGSNLSKQKANPLALGQISAEVQILKQQWSIWSGNTITWLVDYKAREYLAMFT